MPPDCLRTFFANAFLLTPSPLLLSPQLHTPFTGAETGQHDWVELRVQGTKLGDGSPVDCTLIGRWQKALGPKSVMVDEGITTNAPFFEQICGAKADRRLTFTVNHADTTLAIGTVFTQNPRKDSKLVVKDFSTVIFTCMRFGEGVYKPA